MKQFDPHHFYKKFYDIDRNHQEAVNTISKFSSIFNKDSFILEYGCATGFNLRFLKRLGFKNLYGVDAFNDYINNRWSLLYIFFICTT